MTALLFGLQPLVRLAGRLRNGLSPWRRRAPAAPSLPLPRNVQVWSERWRDQQAWLEQLQDGLAAAGGFVRSGGPFDRWDLDLRAGPLGGVKIRTVVEEHGDGKQLLRAKVWPRTTAPGRLSVLALIVLAIVALHQHRPEVLLATVVAIGLLLVIGAEGTATATNLALEQLGELGQQGDEDAPASVLPDEPLALVEPMLTRDEPSWRFGAAALHDSGEVRR